MAQIEIINYANIIFGLGHKSAVTKNILIVLHNFKFGLGQFLNCHARFVCSAGSGDVPRVCLQFVSDTLTVFCGYVGDGLWTRHQHQGNTTKASPHS